MKLWNALYGMIWLAFVAIVLLAWPSPPWPVPWAVLLAVLAVAALARSDFVRLRETRVPGRVKRTASASFGLAVILAVLPALRALQGPIHWAGTGTILGATPDALLFLLALMAGLAIITQASAVAIAFDMWEDRDFEKETAPGEVPPAPRPH